MMAQSIIIYAKQPSPSWLRVIDCLGNNKFHKSALQAPAKLRSYEPTEGERKEIEEK